MDQPTRQPPQLFLPTYEDTFMEHHAGRVITDPAVALTELVANCWDAGAGRVEIRWPSQQGGLFEIRDNGTGMTQHELASRWMMLHYSRHKFQGSDVEFPRGVRKRPRQAFGRNGIGRHAMFFFASSYEISTARDGARTTASVTRSKGDTPFKFSSLTVTPTKEHGTSLRTHIASHPPLSDREVRDLIGTRFIADPEFDIVVNGEPVTFTELANHAVKIHVASAPVEILRFDNDKAGRTAQQTGVAWWVKNRLVGMPSWDAFGGRLLDSRSSAAKRYTYVVKADMLTGAVKDDWTGFHDTNERVEVQQHVEEAIRGDLRQLLYSSHHARKRAALEVNRSKLQNLTSISQDQIARFAEEIQVKCPSIGEKELADSVEVLANLEESRYGFTLLNRLARLDTNDLDDLTDILLQWSITDAKRVLGELRYRLTLIEQLENLVESDKADELHDLQPLFARGLWIFGPEFESVDFLSNRSLATIVREFLGGTEPEHANRRPDFVVLPDTSIGVYAQDRFDESHESIGFAAVVIVELKRGGVRVAYKEKLQTMGYARALRQSGRIHNNTKITAYVLGTSISPEDAETMSDGNTYVIPCAYNAILRRAHQRTFELHRKIKATRLGAAEDADVRELLNIDQTTLFEN